MYVELRHLRTIRAIQQAGGLARAADMLNMTQSALSHQVKGLEDQAGMELFVRRSKPMRLSAAGVRIHTVGLGTAAGTQLKVDGFTLSTRLDEALLRSIASASNGSYHNATDAAGLAAVYDAIEPTWTVRTVPHEITSWVVAAALLCAAAGAGWSVLRTGRVI